MNALHTDTTTCTDCGGDRSGQFPGVECNCQTSACAPISEEELAVDREIEREIYNALQCTTYSPSVIPSILGEDAALQPDLTQSQLLAAIMLAGDVATIGDGKREAHKSHDPWRQYYYQGYRIGRIAKSIDASQTMVNTEVTYSHVMFTCAGKTDDTNTSYGCFVAGYNTVRGN